VHEREIQALIDQALQALRRDDHVRAVAIADQLAAVAPEHAVVRAIRAQALLGSEDGEEALAEARRAVELGGEDPFAHLLLGMAAWRCEKHTLAQGSLERALELSRRDPKFLAEYAWFMASQRGPRPAEEAAREAVDADAASSVAWAALGLAQYRLHRRDDAEASLHRALKLDPNDIYAQSAMVVLLQDRRQDDKAVALAKLLEDSPGTEEFVEAVRSEAKQRQIAKMLLERNVVIPERSGESPRRRWLWVCIAAVMISGMLILLNPRHPATIVLCVIIPLYLLWRARQFLFD